MCRRTTLNSVQYASHHEVHPCPFLPPLPSGSRRFRAPFPPLSRTPTLKRRDRPGNRGNFRPITIPPRVGPGPGQAPRLPERPCLGFFRPHLRPPVDRGERGVVTAIGPMTMQSGAGPPFCRCGSPSRTGSIAGFFPADLLLPSPLLVQRRRRHDEPPLPRSSSPLPGSYRPAPASHSPSCRDILVQRRRRRQRPVPAQPRPVPGSSSPPSHPPPALLAARRPLCSLGPARLGLASAPKSPPLVCTAREGSLGRARVCACVWKEETRFRWRRWRRRRRRRLVMVAAAERRGLSG